METTWWTQPEELDPHQTEVVALPLNGDHLVVGPPGSGKTNLLILRGAYLYGAGLQNIVILTFGRVLREFLAAGSDNYTFPASKIQTYVRWGASLLTENGIQFDSKAKFEEMRDRLREGLDELAKKSDPANVVDCVLIDEAQDYSADEIRIICKFAKQVFVVGDNRQRIYATDGSLTYLMQQIPSVKELPYHYRNGIRICRVADGVRGEVDAEAGLEATSNYDEGKYPSTVQSPPPQSIKSQVKIAVGEIETQLRAYPDGMIGVLCPRHEELNEVIGELERSSLAEQIQVQQYGEGYAAFDPARRVIVTTIHGAKGLEFRALHLLGMDKVVKFPKVQRNLTYTAVTRAKTSLAIYGAAELPGYLEKGIAAAANAAVSPPKLDQLFKR
jgi:superfamily I DNA/RNA helicase